MQIVSGFWPTKMHHPFSTLLDGQTTELLDYCKHVKTHFWQKQILLYLYILFDSRLLLWIWQTLVIFHIFCILGDASQTASCQSIIKLLKEETVL